MRFLPVTAIGKEYAVVAVVCDVPRAGVAAAARAKAVSGPSVLVAELALVAGFARGGGDDDEEEE